MLFFKLFLSFLSCFIILVKCCNYNECRSDAINHEGDWVKCDNCVCNNFDTITDDDSDNCQITDDDLYECWIMQEVDNDSITWSCLPRMKTAWIVGFVFISLFGCCCCAALISYACKPKKNEELKVVLVHSHI